MRLLFLVFCLAVPSLLTAQQARSLDTILVRENRIQIPVALSGRNIQILTAAEIAQLPVRSVPELLSYLAGADLRQRGPFGSQADIALDGSSFDEVVVLVNGIKMSDPQTGHHLLNLPIPISAIRQIEVLHGPAARIYGVNALAGAINIVTEIPQQNEVGVTAYAGSSFQKDTSNGETYFGLGLQAYAALHHKRGSHLLSATRDWGNGYRYNTAFASNRVLYQNELRLNRKLYLGMLGGYLHNKFGASFFYAAPNDREAEETVQTALGAVSLKWQPNSTLSITPRISLRYNRDDYVYVRQRPEAYYNIHETATLTAEVQGTQQFRHGIAGLGIELRQEAINSRQVNNPSGGLGRHQRNNLGAFAEYRHFFGARAEANAGLYLNHNSDWGVQLFPGIDASWRFYPGWKLFANAGTGQRLPTYTDLYYRGPANIGNASLRPEQSASGELGLAWRHGLPEVQLSVFVRNTSNFIDWVRADAGEPWQPQNFATLQTAGAAFRGGYTWQSRKPGAWSLRLNASYTYLNQEVTASDYSFTKYAINALRHQGLLGIDALAFGSWTAGITARYQYRINGNDYTLLDARLGWQHKEWKVFADVNNILDQQYQEIGAVPMPGRWVTLGISTVLRRL